MELLIAVFLPIAFLLSSKGGRILILAVVVFYGLFFFLGISTMKAFLERDEALKFATHINTEIKEFLEKAPGADIATLNAILQPGPGKIGNLGSGLKTDEITNLVPSLNLPDGAKFRYDISVSVQKDRSAHVCIKAYPPAGPKSFILYSNKKSSKPEWEGNVFYRKYLDNSAAAVAGGYCEANGTVGMDAG